MLPLYDVLVLFWELQPNMTCKELKEIITKLIEAGIVKDERPKVEE